MFGNPPSRWRERRLSRSAKARGRMRWMVFLDRVRSTNPVMLTKSFPPTSVMKLSARRSSTVRRSTWGGTNSRPLSAHSVLSDSDRLRQTQWKGQAETTPHVSPAPIRDGSRQHVTRVSQWSAGAESGRVLPRVWEQAQGTRRDVNGREKSRSGRSQGRDGGAGPGGGSACRSGRRHRTGTPVRLQGVRGGGTGMVEGLAIHRPGGGERGVVNQATAYKRVITRPGRPGPPTFVHPAEICYSRADPGVPSPGRGNLFTPLAHCLATASLEIKDSCSPQ